MRKAFSKSILYVALAVLFLLHNDFWLWDNPKMLLGLPIGLIYHIGFCVAASLLMALIINQAWPSHLQEEDTNE